MQHPQPGAEPTLQPRTKRFLVWGGLALLLFDICFWFWWRQWAWGNQVFDGPKGKVVVRREGKKAYATRREVLREAQRSFTYQGHPIHPGIVRLFTPWLSDSDTAVMAVDVAAASGSNQYLERIRTYDTGFHEIELRTDLEPPRVETFGYSLLGVLNHRVLVLQTVDWGGGTGRFYDLVFVRCRVTSIGGRDRLLVQFLDTFPLGDRFMGEVSLCGDYVAITANPLNEHTGLQESTNFSPNFQRWP